MPAIRFDTPFVSRLTGLRAAVAAAGAALALGVAAEAAAQPYSQVVVLGDSLSDPGNAFALRGGVSVPPDYSLDPFFVPSVPYARGGHHFHNGPTWIEQLARSMGLAGSARPAFASGSATASNFATGGARARDTGSSEDLHEQVQAYLNRTGGTAPADALFIIAVGGNDVRDALFAYAAGQNGAPALQAALQAIAGSVVSLYGAGARTFLIWNAPNIGLTPALQSAGPAAAQFATVLSGLFNAELAAILNQLSVGLPGVDIRAFDAFALLTNLVGNPSSYGMSVTQTPCVTPNDAPYTCLNPDVYIFWDGIHPTRATHGIIAEQIAALVM